MSDKFYQGIEPPTPFEDPPKPMFVKNPVNWEDRIMKAIDHPKVNAVVGLFIYGVAWAFAGAIYAHLAW